MRNAKFSSEEVCDDVWMEYEPIYPTECQEACFSCNECNFWSFTLDPDQSGDMFPTGVCSFHKDLQGCLFDPRGGWLAGWQQAGTPNFGGLVLGCMDSYDSETRLILQHFSRPT